MLLRIDSITKRYGARTLLDGVSLDVRPDDRIGLVGRNGEGKTTLLRILAGLEPQDDGQVALRKSAQIGYLRQEIDPSSPRLLIDEVRTVHAPLRMLEERIEALEAEIAALGRRGQAVSGALAARYDEAQQQFAGSGGFEAESDLRATLTGLGFGPAAWGRSLATFSGGWLMRVELAKLLLARPQVLLLDEPTNHLDIPAIRWFEGVLTSYPGSVIVVSHDRTFLDRHVNRIAELEHGRLTVYAGSYRAYLEEKARREQEASARDAKLERQIAHAQSFIDRFGAKASKAAQAESRKKQIGRLEAERHTLVKRPERRSLRFRFRPVPRSGDVVLRLEGVRKAYGDLLVYGGLDLELRRGQRVALVGPNGAGKSTLLRIAAGVLGIDAGTREQGHNVSVAFYAQHQLDALDPARTVLEELEARAPLDLIPRLRTLAGTFLFSGEDVTKRVSVLSGGEKARLALARLLLGEANFLVMDEPTNHLDLQAREVLEAALRRFDGTLMFISHDRSFINALANRVLEVQRGPDCSTLTLHLGDYDAYLRRIEEREAAAAPPRARGRSRESGADRARSRRLRELRLRSETAEAAIEETEREIERLGWLSADPELARDGDRMRALHRDRQACELRLRQLYADWERLHDELAAGSPDPAS